MKIVLQINKKYTYLMESIRPTTLSAHIAGVLSDGRTTYNSEILLTVGDAKNRMNEIELENGFYYVSTTLENGARANSSFNISDQERALGLVVVTLDVATSLDTGSFEKYSRENRKNFSVKYELNSRGGEVVRKRLGPKVGTGIESVADVNSRALDIQISPDKFLLENLTKPYFDSEHLQAGAIGAITGKAVSNASRHTRLMQVPGYGFPKFKGRLYKNFQPGVHRRRFLMISTKNIDVSLMARPDLEVKGAEELLVFFEWGRTKSTSIKAKDAALDALLRYQNMSNLSAAQEIVTTHADRLNDIKGNPLFCLAAAYLLPHWRVDQQTLVRTLPWLHELQEHLPNLPDPFIIEATLMLRKPWNEIYPDQEVRECWQINEATRTIQSALRRGVPALKFGFYHFAHACNALSGAKRIEPPLAPMFRHARDMVYGLSETVDSNEIFTTLNVGRNA